MPQIDKGRLKALRKASGLTQAEVSIALGYRSPLGYHYIESGRCQLKADQAAILAELFAVPFETLFFERKANTAV